MLLVDHPFIVAVRARNEDGSDKENEIRLCMRAKFEQGMPVWSMTDESARLLRDQLNEILGDS